jgi:putative ubiquitin-RnfH superfamily antitoxin RatB of RatAB toxin-antitoxin module
LARIRVEVLYALPHAQQLVALELSEGATVRAALQASGLLEGIPVLVRPRLQFGVYGKLVGPERVLRWRSCARCRQIRKKPAAAGCRGAHEPGQLHD